jgi:hypothetical protein
MEKKNEKLPLLENAMEVKTRDDKTEFTCFSDSAPEELKSLFLEHYEVRDRDYEIFSRAIDTVIEASNNMEDTQTLSEEYIQENYNDFASPYNEDRLGYLTVYNDNEVMEIAKNYSCDFVSLACAIWYDEQVQNACYIIINKYLLK